MSTSLDTVANGAAPVASAPTFFQKVFTPTTLKVLAVVTATLAVIGAGFYYGLPTVTVAVAATVPTAIASLVLLAQLAWNRFRNSGAQEAPNGGAAPDDPAAPAAVVVADPAVADPAVAAAAAAPAPAAPAPAATSPRHHPTRSIFNLWSGRDAAAAAAPVPAASAPAAAAPAPAASAPAAAAPAPAASAPAAAAPAAAPTA